MINVRDLRIDPASLGTEMLLVEIVPVYEYRDNRRTDNCTAFRYTVTLPQLRYEKLGVKIDGKQLLDLNKGFVNVEFSDLEILLYEAQGHVQISAKASGISVVDAPKKPAQA